jgi:L-amino acid N-acyltransferase YncA
VVALASFSAVDETTAEVAVVVQDDWQRQGIGTALVSTLLDAAEKRGFDRFVAIIATDNSIIRRLLNRVGRVVGSHTSLGVSELVFVRRRSCGNAAPGSAVGGEWPVAPQRRRTHLSPW